MLTPSLVISQGTAFAETETPAALIKEKSKPSSLGTFAEGEEEEEEEDE